MARVRNTYLVRWAQGWFEVEELTSQSVHGRHEDFFSAGQANTVEEAARLTAALLAQFAYSKDEQDIAVEPTNGNDVPYADYVVGDVVTVPDHTGAAVSRRVIGFSVTTDDEGNAIYRPTFETP